MRTLQPAGRTTQRSGSADLGCAAKLWTASTHVLQPAERAMAEEWLSLAGLACSATSSVADGALCIAGSSST